MQRKPLRRRSAKTAKVYRDQRIPLVRAMLEANTTCQRCDAARATDLHELKSRARGGSITDPDNLAALCRPCHTWVTTNPAAATAEGWLLNSWD